jgi:hypothetical protein
MTTPATYNAFTKSYKLRYVVHAYRRADLVKTLCGRNIDPEGGASKVKFEADADGSCKKCINVLEIEGRIHPGFAG